MASAEVDDWSLRAECRDPRLALLFYPPIEGETSIERESRELKAKSICASCVVIEDCNDYVNRLKPADGIWAGETEIERRQADEAFPIVSVTEWPSLKL